MSMTHLLFDDEGKIARREWWLATGLLLAAYMLASALAARFLGSMRLDRPVMLFISIAILLPFYSVNAKRFRAVGRHSEWALIGAVLSALATLSGIFLPLHPFNTALGIALMLVILWYVVDLGVIDHTPVVDSSDVDIPVVDRARSQS
jgi:uncharacterized membrane protein YhaH (DUF805 family)